MTAMSVFSRFQKSQDNRLAVEEQLETLFPEVASNARQLPLSALLLLIATLTTLMSTWFTSPSNREEMLLHIQAALVEAEMSAENSLAKAFENYEAGKKSVHAVQNKILKFFPKLKDAIFGMSYADLVSTLALIVAALDRWKPKESLKEYSGPTQEQYAELIAAIKDLRKEEKTD